jgi:glycosyltransferase involved in cell wall biosynthesis
MLSFVVPAYNEELLIARTLRSLHDAGSALGEPFEIVVADDASTDRTTAIAREHGARVVSVAKRQIAATRNAGARAATGELLVFVDADTVVNHAVVRGAVEAMRAGAVGGGCDFHFDGHVPWYGRVLLRSMVPFCRMLGLTGGCFFFCTRAAFEAVGGFDEALFALEEFAMSRALQRLGRFVVLRESVTTSGRKFRTHSSREVTVLLAGALFGGKKWLRKREKAELWWYRARRVDPDPLPRL